MRWFYFLSVRAVAVLESAESVERAIRPLVIYRKRTGGSRSPQGSRTTSILLSLVGTWTLRGQDVFSTCTQMLAGALRTASLSHQP